MIRTSQSKRAGKSRSRKSRAGKRSDKSRRGKRGRTAPTSASYHRQLGQAIARHLPHQGLPLLGDDRRVRWMPRMLVMQAVFMACAMAYTIKDRFDQAREALVGIHPTRRRPGQTPEGFTAALANHGPELLGFLSGHWRKQVREVAGAYWEVLGWIVFSADGTKIDCPRTLANEQELGVTGKNNGGPQMLLTCLFHVGAGLLWNWTTGGIAGNSERGQLLSMIASLPANALLLADAGFTGYDLLKALLDQETDFLIRVGANVNLLRELGYDVYEDQDTVYLWPLSKQTATGRPLQAMPKSLEKVSVPLALRIIRLRDAKGKPVCLLTNVSKERMSDSDAARLYKMRWGVEVVWRDLKQTMGHHKVLGRKPGTATAELDWAMAGLWLMQLMSAERMLASKKPPQQHSPASTLRVLRRAMTGRGRRGSTLGRELAGAVKDDYARKKSKQARHRVRKRGQKPPGEPKTRMATDVEIRLAQRLRDHPPPQSIAA